MQPSDRTEFNAQMGRLAAGFSCPDTKERNNAYWESFNSLALSQFARIVEHALSPEWTQHIDPKRPAVVPTVPQLWQIHSMLKSRSITRESIDTTVDSLALFGNRMFLFHLLARHGLGSTPGKPSMEYLVCLKCRDILIDEFTAYIRDGDELATPREYVRRWVAMLKREGFVIHDLAMKKYRFIASSAKGKAPFPRAMIGEVTTNA